MMEENPTTPVDPKNQLGGEKDKSPPNPPRKPDGGRTRKTASKSHPVTVHGDSKNKDGRTATESTRRSGSRHGRESVAHSKSVHNNEDILDRKRQEIEECARLIKKREYEIREIQRVRRHPEDSGLSRRNSRGDGLAIVEYKKAPSRRGGSRSRSPTPRKKRASSRKRRSRSRSVSSEQRGARKHCRDRYERPDPDWEKYTPREVKGREEGTMSAREAARKALSNIASSPFAKRLQEAKLPSRVKHGTFVLYETNTDPVAHVQHYQQAMFMHEGDDAIMCKMFPSSLGKVALSWFHKLGPNTIRGWRQLAEEFTARFLTSRKAPKTFESLSVMKQGENEPIRDYAKKYWETFNEIEGCSEEYAIATFKTGLPVRGELRKSLNMSPVGTLAKLMERIEQHARNEDDILREDGKAMAEQAKGFTRKVENKGSEEEINPKAHSRASQCSLNLLGDRAEQFESVGRPRKAV